MATSQILCFGHLVQLAETQCGQCSCYGQRGRSPVNRRTCELCVHLNPAKAEREQRQHQKFEVIALPVAEIDACHEGEEAQQGQGYGGGDQQHNAQHEKCQRERAGADVLV